MSKIKPNPRDAYRHFVPIQTRWNDNDVYGHVNNVVFYEFFDTAVNCFLIEQAGLDIHQGSVIGLVVETQCNYFAPAAYPDQLEAGIRVTKIGNSSVRYEVGIFSISQDSAIAQGHFVHVYVDRETRKSTSLPQDVHQALERII